MQLLKWNIPPHSQHIVSCSLSQQSGGEDVNTALFTCTSSLHPQLLLAPRDPISCAISRALVIPIAAAHGQVEKTLGSFVFLERPRKIVLASDALLQALCEPERDAARQIWRLRIRGRRGNRIAPVRLPHVDLAADTVLVRIAQFVKRLGKAVCRRYFKARECQLLARIGLPVILVRLELAKVAPIVALAPIVIVDIAKAQVRHGIALARRMPVEKLCCLEAIQPRLGMLGSGQPHSLVVEASSVEESILTIRIIGPRIGHDVGVPQVMIVRIVYGARHPDTRQLVAVVVGREVLVYELVDIGVVRELRSRSYFFATVSN